MTARPQEGGGAAGAAAAEWRGGWPTVLVASLGISLSTGHTYSQGLFMAPLEQAFGWTRTEITTGPFLLGIVAGLGIMFSGVLADRFGPRRIVLPGLLLYAATMAGLMATGPDLWRWYAGWLLIAPGLVLVTPAIWTAAIVARFAASRGLALAVSLAGTGLSSAVAPSLIERLIADHGWRAGYAFFPAFALLLVFPLAFLLFDRAPRPVPPVPAAADTAADMRIGPALRSPVFLLLLAASILFACPLIALLAHFVPIVTEGGLDRPTAAAAVGVIGLCSIAGRLTTGFLLDRLGSAVVAAAAFLLPVLPVLILIRYDGSGATAFGAAVLLGVSLGAEVDIVAYLTAHHFGVRRYATFLGAIQGAGALAVGGGPLAGGMIHDVTGRYDLLLWGCIPLFVAATAAIVALGRQRVPDDG